MVRSINKSNNRVLVIHEEGNAANNPSLVSMLTDVAGTNEIHYISVDPRVEKLDVKSIVKNRLQNKITNLIINRGYSKNLLIFSTFQEIFICLFRNPKLIIGVDRQGLVVGGFMSQIFRIPLVYISFEIIFEKETSRKFKKLERYFSKKVDLWIIQDEIRAQALMNENNLSDRNKLIIPIGVQSSKKNTDTPKKEKYLRKKLGISEDSKIAIMFGSLAEWTMANEVILSLNEWPKNWNLLIHHRYGDTLGELSSKNLSEYLNHPALHISEETITDLSCQIDVLTEVDAGIAFYSPTTGIFRGDNIKFIGRASGKVSMFAKHDIPIITNKNGLLSEDIREFSAGLVVEGVPDLPAALIEIEKSRESYRSSTYYNEILNFDNYSSEFRKQIGELISRRH
jgi:hypothetical protein